MSECHAACIRNPFASRDGPVRSIVEGVDKVPLALYSQRTRKMAS